MDSTLGVHPWTDASRNFDPKDLWLNYQANHVLRNVGGTAILLGPSAYALAPFAQQMNVVRGIYMCASDVGHPAAIGHTSSGYAQENAPLFASHIAEKSAQLKASQRATKVCGSFGVTDDSRQPIHP